MKSFCTINERGTSQRRIGEMEKQYLWEHHSCRTTCRPAKLVGTCENSLELNVLASIIFHVPHLSALATLQGLHSMSHASLASTYCSPSQPVPKGTPEPCTFFFFSQCTLQSWPDGSQGAQGAMHTHFGSSQPAKTIWQHNLQIDYSYTKALLQN